jgi:hypothetical protein
MNALLDGFTRNMGGDLLILTPDSVSPVDPVFYSYIHTQYLESGLAGFRTEIDIPRRVVYYHKTSLLGFVTQETVAIFIKSRLCPRRFHPALSFLWPGPHSQSHILYRRPSAPGFSAHVMGW